MTIARKGTATALACRRIRSSWTLGWLSLVLAFGGQAEAQLLPVPLPEVEAKAGDLEPGAWVSYAVRRGRGQRPMMVRLAALTKERKGQWFEFSFTGATGLPVVFKALVEGPLAAPRRLRSVVLQLAGQQPLAVPAKMLDQQLPRSRRGRSAKAVDRGKVVGRGKVKVAAGVFRATQYRRRDARGRRVDAWTSRQVPGWRLVKLTGPELSLELTGHGKAARSQIHGTPLPINAKLLEAFGGLLQ